MKNGRYFLEIAGLRPTWQVDHVEYHNTSVKMLTQQTRDIDSNVHVDPWSTVGILIVAGVDSQSTPATIRMAECDIDPTSI